MLGRRRTDTTDWGAPAEAPRTDISDSRKLLLRRRVINVVLGAVLVAFPIQSIALASLVGQQRNQTSTTVTYSASTMTATKAMLSWLASTPAPVPGGRIITTGQPQAVTFDGVKDDSWHAEIVEFGLIDERGLTYRASVMVAVSPTGATKVMGTPGLEPTPADDSGDWADGGPWPGLRQANLSESVQRAVQSWASAYVSGDDDTLRLAVGDPESNHFYTPLTGVTSVTAKATYASKIGNDSSTITAQVTLDLVWDGQVVRGSSTGSTPATLDVLVERADTASPVVTAWGAPGTGPTLTRYANAVLGERSVATPPVTVSPSGTPSGGPSASPSTSPGSTSPTPEVTR